MSEQAHTSASPHTQERPFPWFCPHCGRQEVRRVTIPYQCQRYDNGHPITVVVSALDVPRCGNCGELVFTYETDERIDRAFKAQIDAGRNGTSPADASKEDAQARKASA